eukprot:scaffold24.g2928.t1
MTSQRHLLERWKTEVSQQREEFESKALELKPLLFGGLGSPAACESPGSGRQQKGFGPPLRYPSFSAASSRQWTGTVHAACAQQRVELSAADPPSDAEGGEQQGAPAAPDSPASDDEEVFVTAAQSRATSAALTACTSAVSLASPEGSSLSVLQRLEQTAARLAARSPAGGGASGGSEAGGEMPLRPAAAERGQQGEVVEEGTALALASEEGATSLSLALPRSPARVGAALEAASGTPAEARSPVSHPGSPLPAADSAASPASEARSVSSPSPASDVRASLAVAAGASAGGRSPVACPSWAAASVNWESVAAAGEPSPRELGRGVPDFSSCRTSGGTPARGSGATPARGGGAMPARARSPLLSPAQLLTAERARAVRTSAELAAAEANVLLSEARHHLTSAFELLACESGTCTAKTTQSPTADSPELSDTASSRGSGGVPAGGLPGAQDASTAEQCATAAPTAAAEPSLPDSLGLGMGADSPEPEAPAAELAEVREAELTDSSAPLASPSSPQPRMGSAEPAADAPTQQQQAESPGLRTESPDLLRRQMRGPASPGAAAAAGSGSGGVFPCSIDSMPLQGSVCMPPPSDTAPFAAGADADDVVGEVDEEGEAAAEEVGGASTPASPSRAPAPAAAPNPGRRSASGEELLQLEQQAGEWAEARMANWARPPAAGSDAEASPTRLVKEAMVVVEEAAAVGAEKEEPPAASPCVSQGSGVLDAPLLQQRTQRSSSPEWHEADSGSAGQGEASSEEGTGAADGEAAAAAGAPGPLRNALLQQAEGAACAVVAHAAALPLADEQAPHGWAAAADGGQRRGSAVRTSASPDSQPLRFSLLCPQSVERRQGQPLASAATRGSLFGTDLSATLPNVTVAEASAVPLAAASDVAPLPLHGRQLPVPASPLRAASPAAPRPPAPAALVATVASVRAATPPSVAKQEHTADLSKTHGAWEAQRERLQQPWTLGVGWGAAQAQVTQAVPPPPPTQQQQQQAEGQQEEEPEEEEEAPRHMLRAVSVQPRQAAGTQQELREGLLSENSEEGSVRDAAAAGRLLRSQAEWSGGQRLCAATPAPGSAHTVSPLARSPAPCDALRRSQEQLDVAAAASAAAEAELETRLSECAQLTPLSAIQALSRSMAQDPRWAGQRRQMRDVLGRLETRVREARERAQGEAQRRHDLEQEVYDLKQRVAQLAEEAEEAARLQWELLGARRELASLQRENDALRHAQQREWELAMRREEEARTHELRGEQEAAEAAARERLLATEAAAAAREHQRAAEEAARQQLLDQQRRQQRRQWRERETSWQPAAAQAHESVRSDASWAGSGAPPPQLARPLGQQPHPQQQPYLARAPTFLAPLSLGVEEMGERQRARTPPPPERPAEVVARRQYHTYAAGGTALDEELRRQLRREARQATPPRQGGRAAAPTHAQLQAERQRLLSAAAGSSLFAPLGAGARHL